MILGVTLSTATTYINNFFPLVPGHEYRILVRTYRHLGVESIPVLCTYYRIVHTIARKLPPLQDPPTLWSSLSIVIVSYIILYEYYNR